MSFDNEFYGVIYIHSRYIPVILMAADEDHSVDDLIRELGLASVWNDCQDLSPEILKNDIAELELDDFTYRFLEDCLGALEVLHIPYDAEHHEVTQYYRCDPDINTPSGWNVLKDTIHEDPMVSLHKLVELKAVSIGSMLKYIDDAKRATTPPLPIDQCQIREEEVALATVTLTLSEGTK